MNNILKKSYIGDICDINLSTYSPSENWKFVNYLDTGNITKNKIAPHWINKEIKNEDIDNETIEIFNDFNEFINDFRKD